jgi:hypothetical protein
MGMTNKELSNLDDVLIYIQNHQEWTFNLNDPIVDILGCSKDEVDKIIKFLISEDYIIRNVSSIGYRYELETKSKILLSSGGFKNKDKYTLDSIKWARIAAISSIFGIALTIAIEIYHKCKPH